MKISKDLKIEIRPIPGKNGIRQFSEVLEYFSQPHVIAPFVNPVSLKYETGLNEEDKEYLKKLNCPYDLTDNYVRGVAHPFWESALVKTELINRPIFLYPGRSMIDFIKWRYLLVNNYIYKSEEEMRSGAKPEATHYIYNESEEISLKAAKLDRKNDLIRNIGKLSLKRKRDIILLIENEVTDNKDEKYLTVKFDEILQNKDKTAQLEELLLKKADDIALSAEIRAAIQKNVLRRTKKGIFFFETNLGFREDDVKEFLNKPENQEILLNIKSKIQ